MFKAIHHIAIICSNYERSKDFYVHTFGFEIISETYRKERDSYKLNLNVGDTCQLELFSFPSPPGRISDPEACGLRHLAFAVNNMEATVTQLKIRGIVTEPIRTDKTTNKKFTFFKDPDGLPIEIYEQ